MSSRVLLYWLDVFGKPGEGLTIAVGPRFPCKRTRLRSPTAARWIFEWDWTHPRNFPVALSSGQLLQKGFGIEIRET